MIDELRLVLRDIDSLGAGGALKIALSARRRAHIRERTHPTAAGPPMFEHREGHPAPPGAGTASRLPRGHGSLALSITGRDRFRPIARARHRNARLHARQRPDRRCLSIVRVTRHHPVLGLPLVCRAATIVSLYRSHRRDRFRDDASYSQLRVLTNCCINKRRQAIFRKK